MSITIISRNNLNAFQTTFCSWSNFRYQQWLNILQVEILLFYLFKIVVTIMSLEHSVKKDLLSVKVKRWMNLLCCSCWKSLTCKLAWLNIVVLLIIKRYVVVCFLLRKHSYTFLRIKQQKIYISCNNLYF